MRWYDAAMSKPIQFSIRRMLCGAFLICAATCLFAPPFKFNIDGYTIAALWIGAGMIGWTGIRLVFYRP
jgi:hypothetical protein